MENYNLNIRKGVHTIKITLQFNQYKGQVFYRKYGNTKGMTALNIDFGDNSHFESDCNFIYDEVEELYSFELKDKDGNILIFDGVSSEEIENMVVCLEIIDFTEEKIVE